MKKRSMMRLEVNGFVWFISCVSCGFFLKSLSFCFVFQFACFVRETQIRSGMLKRLHVLVYCFCQVKNIAFVLSSSASYSRYFYNLSVSRQFCSPFKRLVMFHPFDSLETLLHLQAEIELPGLYPYVTGRSQGYTACYCHVPKTKHSYHSRNQPLVNRGIKWKKYIIWGHMCK